MLIYKVTNRVNGKIYVGQTVQGLRARQNDHRRKAFVHGSKGHFHAAIRKHGFDSFSWEIIDRAESRDELNQKEKWWIEHLDTMNPSRGYNLKSGGDQPRFTEETKRKIGDAGRGIRRSEEFKANLRRIESGSGNPFFGKKHTDEAKKKNREAHIGRKLTPEHVAKCVHRGSDNWRSKITEDQVREVKQMLRDGVRQCEICKRLGFHKNIIGPIARGISWRHIIA